TFYLFTLPTWQLLSGWGMTLAVAVCAVALFFVVIGGGFPLMTRVRETAERSAWRGLSIGFAAVLALSGVRVYLGRFERLFAHHAIFSGIGYTDAHFTVPGMLVVAVALALGAVVALVNAVRAPRLRWLGAAVAPAVVCYVGVGVITWYVNSFIVKPNELVR